jgi:hypothetical protein
VPETARRFLPRGKHARVPARNQQNFRRFMMKISRNAVALAAALLLCGVSVPAFADIKDYEFKLVQNEAKKGEAVIAVQLLNKKTGKTVPDAVISAKRIDMAPDGMAEMTTKIEQASSTEPGVYRFKVNLPMEGRWQLSLGAKVQGETGTVESKLVLKATP